MDGQALTGVDIRPLREGDVEAADAVAWSAMRTVIPGAEETRDPDHERRALRKMGHLLQTDPDGCWVAESRGQIVGVSLGLRRDGVFGLSLLAVAPEAHGRGVGRALLHQGLAYGQDAHGGIIASSTHPAAMRSYLRAGFRVRPSVSLAGALNATARPEGLCSRPGDVDRDRAVLQHAAMHVRGASYGSDVAVMVESGHDLLVCDQRGFAVHFAGSPALLCAVDEGAARDLLHSCFAAAPRGATVDVDWVTEGQDWAAEVALSWGLALSVGGPIFVRGQLGTMRPWLPSGAYL